MRKLLLHVNVTLDGFVEGPDRSIDWHFVDEEFEAYSNRLLRSVGGVVLGRVAFDLLAAYWPTAAQRPGVGEEHRESARHLERLPKYVLTRGGARTEAWAGSRALDADWEGDVRALKEEPGKDLVLFGGAEAARAMLGAGLVDEVRLVVNPVVLGGGTPLFRGVERTPMRLLDVERLRSGVLVATYRPLGGE